MSYDLLTQLIRLIDKIIHKVPYLPGRLQTTWVDLTWEWIEKLVED